MNSFHTLGRVKGLSHPEEAARSTFMRTLTEREVVARADSIVAATPYEYDDLVDHYGAHPERLWVTPPGVSHLIFSPGEREAARSWLGIGAEPCLLFVGRIQPLKGLDLAVRTLAKLPEQLAAGDGPPRLLIVGGPSGELGDAHAATIRALTAELGVANRVEFIDPQPHPALAAFYRAADVLVMPSRTESFGLVAAEAQACGLPVVAGDVGGLSYVVRHGESGFLIDSAEPAWKILSHRDFEAEIMATPVIDGARIYVRTARALYCFEQR